MNALAPAAAGEPIARTISWKRFAVELSPFLLIALGGAAMAVAGRTAVHSTVSIAHWTITDRLANVVFGYCLYLVKAVWPEPMVALYPLRRVYNMTAVLTAAALLLTLTFLAFRVGRRRPYILFGWLWWAGSLLPTIGLVQTGPQSLADRYTYLPYVGLSVALLWWASDLSARLIASPKFRTACNCAVGGLMLISLGIESRRQLNYWRTSFAMFEHALAFSPQDPLLNASMGTEYRLAGQPDVALGYYSLSVRDHPNNPDAQDNLAWMLMRVDPKLALPHFQAAARQLPDDPHRWWSVGYCHQQMGQIPLAIENYRRALDSDRDYEPAQSSLRALEASRVK